VCTTLGITPVEAGELCWRSVQELAHYWATKPPLHEMVAAYFGIKDTADQPRKPLDVNEMRAKGEAMMRAFDRGDKVRLA